MHTYIKLEEIITSNPRRDIFSGGLIDNCYSHTQRFAGRTRKLISCTPLYQGKKPLTLYIWMDKQENEYKAILWHINHSDFNAKSLEDLLTAIVARFDQLTDEDFKRKY